MVPRKKRLSLILLLITALFLLAACERPTPGRDDPAADADATTEEAGDAAVDTGDADSGAADTTGDEAAAEDTAAEESTEAAAEDAAAEDESTEESEDASTDETAAEEAEADEEESAEEADETASEDEAASEEGDADDPHDDDDAEDADDADDDADDDEDDDKEEMSGERPSTHTVMKGENLFRIGLKYGLSWVELARYNKIMNPHAIRVGQVIKIPPLRDKPMHEHEEEEGGHGGMEEEEVEEKEEETTDTDSTSSTTETTYTVKHGDNLFRIGLKYDVSWIQIAEANGIKNPNRIKVGQTLKIPVSAPGPSPQFTHHVRKWDTLFKISMQYGVDWAAIAAENEIEAPYIIYPGQELVIPGKDAS